MRIKNLLIGVALVGICITAGFYGCNDAMKESTSKNLPAPTEPVGNTTEPSEAFSISTSVGQVDILAIEPLLSEHLVRLHLRVWPTGHPSINRILTAQILSDVPDEAAFVGTLSDDENSLLWRFEFRSIDEESNRLRITIADQSSQVIAEHWESDSEIFETYTIDGRRHSFNINKSEMEHGRELYQSGLVNGRFDRRALPLRSPSDKAIIATIENAQALYFSSAMLSTGSIDADLTEKLFSNARVIETIKNHVGSPEDQIIINKWWRKVCAGAAVCTYIACEYFGPNGVCMTCGAVALGCAIAELFGPSWF